MNPYLSERSEGSEASLRASFSLALNPVVVPGCPVVRRFDS